MYDLTTLKAVKQIFDKHSNAKSMLLLSQLIAEAETRLEQQLIETKTSGESTTNPTEILNHYGC